MKSRLPILDGFRVIAITFVILGHYTNFSSNTIIKSIAGYGWIGVPIFFIISGFVIYLTLEKTKNYKEFLKKRYLRLAPGMFVCSTLTFLYFYYIYTGTGYENSKSIPNYLIANTFIDPHFFDLFYNKIVFYYIDSSYWSLWVEVCFYVLIGFLYFLSPKNTIRNYLIICVIGIPLYILISSKTGQGILGNYLNPETLNFIKILGRTLAFFHECLWFLLGLYLYKLYNDKKNYKLILYMSITMLALILWQRQLVLSLIFIAILLVYLTFVYKPQYLSFLTHKIISRLGIASYSAYLIHYHIGVSIIKQVNLKTGEESYLLPIILLGCVYLFSLLSYKYLETPLSKLLKNILIKK